MSAAALSGLEPISAVSASGREPIAGASAGGWEPIASASAAERVQQIQALIARIEHRPTGAGFASALNTAQAGGAGAAAGAAAYTAALPAPGAYSSLAPTAGAYSSLAPTAGAYTPAIPAAGAYASAIPAAGAYASAIPAAAAPASAAPYPAGASAAAGGSAYTPLIEQTAARYGLDPALLSGLIQQESGFNPSARSSAGALGLTQLMPSTAASLGVSEPLDPAQSIEGGARYLSGLLQRFGGNTASALAAYNAGPGAVEQYGGVPPYPETQQYVAKVLGYAASYRQSGAIA